MQKLKKKKTVLIKLKRRWLQTGLLDFKNTKQLHFVYGSFLYLIFYFLEIFEFVKCTLFHHKPVGQTQ